MVRRIVDIGQGRYRLRVEAFSELLGEDLGVQEHASRLGHPHRKGDCDRPGSDPELENAFQEVMQLYREYAKSGSMDALVRLKCRLEEVSLRYRSLALAEEVLQINSCLPYERRITGAKDGE